MTGSGSDDAPTIEDAAATWVREDPVGFLRDAAGVVGDAEAALSTLRAGIRDRDADDLDEVLICLVAIQAGLDELARVLDAGRSGTGAARRRDPAPGRGPRDPETPAS